jgi:NarL family two-component system sensor histidine kinase YdfH
MTSTTASTSPAAPGERAFFIFLTLILVSTYAFAVAATPQLLEPVRVAALTIVLIGHLALHWSLYFGKVKVEWFWLFVVVQGLLALALSVLSLNIALHFGAFMALIGESVGMFRGRWRSAAGAALYLGALSLVAVGLGFGWDGWVGWLLSSGPMTLFVIIYVTLYSRQAEARERAQALAQELKAANRQLSDYAARVEDLTIAAERQRIARELHDTLSQGLAGLILQLEAADAHLGNQRVEKARAIVSDAMAQARVTLADARNAIDDLRKPAASDLEPALCREVARFIEATGIAADCHVDAELDVDEAIADGAVRIVSEALSNVARHAQARRVTVSARADGGELVLSIEDDGIGFDPAAMPAGHYGLIGARERARLVGGRFDVSSRPGAGTMLSARLPLATSPEAR